MLLENKNAVIYGAGGVIGGAVARKFAHEGAKVFLAGRTREKLDAVAEGIEAAGGSAEIAVLDALDEGAVDEHADAVVSQAGSIDVSFNLTTHPSVHGTPLAEMAVEDYMVSVTTAVRTTFLTAKAAARPMISQRAGAILFFGGSGDPIRDYFIGGTQVAFDAVESMRRQLAVELGPHGNPEDRRHTGVDPRGHRGTGGDRREASRGANDAGPRGDPRRRGQRGGLRGLGPRPHYDGGDGQHQLRRTRRLLGAPGKEGLATRLTGVTLDVAGGKIML